MPSPKAIILAAGRGSRLHPYTKDKPKCLTEIGGKSLITRQLETLREAGIDDIIIATGYCADHLSLTGTRQIHNADWQNTNMVETLFRAETEFGDNLIVAYADIVYEQRVLKSLLNSPHDISVVIDLNWQKYWSFRFDNPLDDAESLKLDGQGRITSIGDRVTDVEEIEGQYIGLMRFSGAGIAALKAARNHMQKTSRPWMKDRPLKQAYMTDLIMEMILMKTDVFSIPIESGWLELDTTEDLVKTNALFNDGSINQFYDSSI